MKFLKFLGAFFVIFGHLFSSILAKRFQASCKSFYPLAGTVFSTDTTEFLEKLPFIYSCGRVYLAVEDSVEMYKVCVEKQSLPEYYVENVKKMRAADFSSKSNVEKAMHDLSVKACNLINKDFADRATDESESTDLPKDYSVNVEFEFETPGLKKMIEKDESCDIYDPNYKAKAANGFRPLSGILLALTIFIVMAGGAIIVFYAVKNYIPHRRDGDPELEPPIQEIINNSNNFDQKTSDLPPSYAEVTNYVDTKITTKV